MRRATDAAIKARALQRAAEVGAAQAARELGVPAATIRTWRRRAGATASGGGPLDPDDAWRAAREALDTMRERLASGDTLAAQRAAIVLGVTIDKANILSDAAERQGRLAEAQARIIFAVLEQFLEALGVPFGAAARRTLARLLWQAGSGVPLAASPADAAEAARELRPFLRVPEGEHPPRRGLQAHPQQADPGDRAGACVMRIELRAGDGIATDNLALVLGRRLTTRLARRALDDAVGGGDESYYFGPYRCRRMGPRRVDCEIAEQFLRMRPPYGPYKVRCASVRTVTLGRDGLLRQRRYRCPRRNEPMFRRHPTYRTRPAVLPLDI